MESVGEVLREAREKKKCSIDNASRETKIKRELIEALESDQFDRLPAPTYVRGFLKIYASFLGLDPDAIVQMYLESHRGASEQVLVLDVESKVKPPQDRQFMSYILIVAAAVVVIAVAAFLMNRITRRREAPASIPQMEILEPSTATLDEADLLEPVAPALQNEMELRLKAAKDVWVKVAADGATVFQNVIKEGEEEFWKGSDGFTMRVGRPDAVILTLDGAPISVSGKTSKPMTIHIDNKGDVEIEQ